MALVVAALSMRGPRPLTGRPALAVAARSGPVNMSPLYDAESRRALRYQYGTSDPYLSREWDLGYDQGYLPAYEREYYDQGQYPIANSGYYGSVAPTQLARTPSVGRSIGYSGYTPHVEGLSSLVEYLAPETQDAALQYCMQTDTPSVQVLVLMEQDEAFIAAVGAQVGGNIETLLRDRLAAVRRALGAKGYEPRAWL